MRTTPNRTLAILISIVTAFGLLLSLVFIIQIWRFRKPVTTSLQSGINRTSELVKTTQQGLNIMDEVVKNVYTSTVSLDDSAKTLIKTVDNTNQFISSANTFMGDNLVTTILNTQTALDSAQSSAVVIDNLLTTLSRVPFIGIKYNPSKPLNVALGEVSDSLNPLTGSLRSFQTSLTTTQTNMQSLRTQIIVLDQNITDINRNLEATQMVISNYQTQLNSFTSWVDKADNSITKWVNTATWVLTFVVLWLVFTQISILLVAINMFSGTPVDVIEVVPKE